jgi:hypothetical protein
MDSGLAPRGAPRNDEGRELGQQKKPRHRCRGFALLDKSPERSDQKSMPPMPPPGGMPAPAPVFFFGSSATMASVVISSAAT